MAGDGERERERCDWIRLGMSCQLAVHKDFAKGSARRVSAAAARSTFEIGGGGKGVRGPRVRAV